MMNTKLTAFSNIKSYRQNSSIEYIDNTKFLNELFAKISRFFPLNYVFWCTPMSIKLVLGCFQVQMISPS